MHCSKGPVYFPLKDFGLIPPKECKSDFIDLVKKAAPIHWNEVKTWLTQKHQGCLRGAKQLFDDNIKYFVPNMSIEWSKDEKLYSVAEVIQSLASYNLYVDYDF